jgi:hypothetical protein
MAMTMTTTTTATTMADDTGQLANGNKVNDDDDDDGVDNEDDGKHQDGKHPNATDAGMVGRSGEWCAHPRCHREFSHCFCLLLTTVLQSLAAAIPGTKDAVAAPCQQQQQRQQGCQ